MKRRRLGVFDLTMPGWTAGRTYTESVLRSLLDAGASDRFEVVRLTTLKQDEGFAGLPVEVLRFAPTPAAEVEGAFERVASQAGALRPYVGKAGRALGRVASRLRKGSQLLRAGKTFGLSVLLPAMEVPERAGYGVVGWIPDFQHAHQPSFFSPAELSWRDFMYEQLAMNASQVILSSRAALDDYKRFTPRHAAKGKQASFPSMFCFEALPAQVGHAVAKYNLPRRFALVVNQMWAHKNPDVVVEAAALARDQGTDVNVVLIGMPADYRDPQNETVSRVLQRIAKLGLAGKVIVLGKVPFPDLLDLMRTAAVLVQPSRFEGWSTSVEDAKSLGKPLICSDLAVHREQAPGALGFFGCDDPTALAALLCEHVPRLTPGHDPSVERRALDAERAFARAFGATLLEVCEQALDGADRS